jgi:hypothetical protein
MKATNKPNKGAESHNPGHGWFMGLCPRSSVISSTLQT